MGAQGSHNLKPEELHEFRRLHSVTTNLNLEIPERPENRQATDRAFSIVYLVTLLITIAFVAYSLVLVKDLRSSSYSDYPSESKFNYGDDSRYQNQNDNRSIDMDFSHNWWKIICSLLISLTCAMVMLVLLRFYTAAVVWTSLACTVLLAILMVLLLWIAYMNAPSYQRSAVVPAFSTIGLIIGIVLLVFMVKKVKLIILLFKEAAISLFALPGLLWVPFIHLFCLAVVVGIFVLSEMFIIAVNANKSVGNVATSIAVFLNFIMVIWTIQFFQGFQTMLVAGSIATWYFARNKRYADAPIKSTMSNIFKFHLGSIYFGSMIITLVIILRAILSALFKNEKLKQAVESCLSCIGDIVKYLTKNAYIETAIHGQPFWRSGKRAAKLLATNATDMIAVNYVGDAVLGFIVFFLMLVNAGISYLIFMSEKDAVYAYIMICFIATALVVSPIFSLFETCVDSLFICFCEDKEVNDGIARPFCMSRGLMEFMDKSKQAKAAQIS